MIWVTVLSAVAARHSLEASTAVRLLLTNDPCAVSVCPATHPGPPSSVIIGAAFPLAVVALDADGARDFTYTGTVHFSSSDPFALLPIGFTFTAADAGGKLLAASFFTLGSQTITVVDQSIPALSGSLTLAVTPSPEGIPALSGRAVLALVAGLALVALFLLRGRL